MRRIGAVCRMSISSANRCRCFRELRAHDLEGRPLCRPKNSGTDGARPSMITELLGAFFEGSRFATQIRERFARKMERAGEKDEMRSLTRLIQCISNRRRNGVGE